MIPQCEPLITDKERKALNAYMKIGGYLTEYKKTEEFEEMLADFLGIKYVSVVTSGTAALFLALKASGVGCGDKVLIPDYTMIATATAVSMCGAEPVLVDVSMPSFCMDIQREWKKPPCMISDVKALVHVEIDGSDDNLEQSIAFCKKYKIPLIEDSCQAFGSKHDGKYLGTLGRFGCFSMSFHKIITTGEGGIVVSQTKKDYEKIERLKNHGRLSGGTDIHDHIGYNFLFTDLQATVGIEQLKTINKRIEKKKELYKWYYESDCPEEFVPWFFHAHTASPHSLQTHLKENNIGSRLLYPAIHTQKPFKDNRNRNWLSLYARQENLWLPSSLTLTKKQVEHIKEVCNENF